MGPLDYAIRIVILVALCLLVVVVVLVVAGYWDPDRAIARRRARRIRKVKRQNRRAIRAEKWLNDHPELQ